MSVDFSIIIPTYNRSTFIKKTIESALCQEGSFEIIVVDDGSTDNTEEVVRTLKHDHLHYYKKNNGERGVARNYGAKKAKGNYVYFLDSDDLLYPNHLSEASQFIKECQPKIFFQQYEYTLGDGSIKNNIKINQPIINELLIHKGNFMSCHGVFIERELFLDNPFNEDRKMAGSEDYELWLRLAAQYPIHFSNKVTSTLIHHDDRSILNMDKQQLIERKQLMLKYLFNNPIIMEKFGKYKSLLTADAYSYIALHLGMTKHYREGLKYLIKSIAVYPLGIFKKRMLGLAKKLILRM